MGRGAAVGAGMAVVLVAVWGLVAGETWSVVLAACVAGGCVAIGAAIGAAARRGGRRRFLRLAGLGLVLIYAAALVFAAAMLVADGTVPTRELPGSILFLGTTGFVLFGAMTLPLLCVGVAIIARWVRPVTD